MIPSAILRSLRALACVLAILPIACDRRSESEIVPGPASTTNELVLYVSADDALYRPVVQSFEAATGAKVLVVADTEATKTFGLVRRLIEEKSKPRADVFWASEPLGMIRLAQAGVLQDLAIAAQQEKSGPAHWVPLAYRARVIVFHKDRFKPGEEPRRLGDLLNPELKGKIGLARPQFGTTRTHMATLLAMFGEEKLVAFLRSLKANGARLYDGNSAVAQAVAQGEISAGLTDSDDVEAGKDQKWPISARGGTGDLRASKPGEPAGIVLMMPHTAGMIGGAKNPELSRKFIAHLLSDDVQKLFLSSKAAMRPGEASSLPPTVFSPEAVAKMGPEAHPDYRAAAPLESKAVELFERVWAEP